MDPTLANGEHLIVVRTTSIKHFDIVVAAEGNKNIVKRVIGMPGDTITYENDMLSINGKKSMKLISSNTRINLPRTNSKKTYAYNQYFQELASIINSFHNRRTRKRQLYD